MSKTVLYCILFMWELWYIFLKSKGFYSHFFHHCSVKVLISLKNKRNLTDLFSRTRNLDGALWRAPKKQESKKERKRKKEPTLVMSQPWTICYLLSVLGCLEGGIFGQKSVVHKESIINLICLEKEKVHFKRVNRQKCVIDVLKATKKIHKTLVVKQSRFQRLGTIIDFILFYT